MGELRYYDADTMEDRGKAPRPETLEDRQRKKTYHDKTISTEEFNQWIADKYGTFYFVIHKILKKKLNKQYIIRFLYLCTFMNFSGEVLYGDAHAKLKISDEELEKQLKKGIHPPSRYMTENDLQEVLKLSRTETNKTKTAFLYNELVFINKKGNLQINDKYCFKGFVALKDIKTSRTRIFENAIKDIYEKAKPIEHKRLALLITILPYINLHNNIICHNALCDSSFQLEVIDLKKLCPIVEYSESNKGRLKRELLDLRVGGEKVVMFNEIDGVKSITINPRIYYGGSIEDFKTLKGVASYFDLKVGLN